MSTASQTADLLRQVAQLAEEVQVLRAYGNKDCTAMADEELERRRAVRAADPGSQPVVDALVALRGVAEAFDRFGAAMEALPERQEELDAGDRLMGALESLKGELLKRSVAAGGREGTVHVLEGGPRLQISVGGRLATFEAHPYCGPVELDPETGDPLEEQDDAFLHAASLWYQQGQRMEGGLCRWDHPAVPIVEWTGPRTGRVVGWKPARRGE